MYVEEQTCLRADYFTYIPSISGGRLLYPQPEKLSRNTYRVLMGRPEGKRSLGWPQRRIILKWIKMDLKVGCDGDCIDLAHDRVQ